MCSRGLVHDKMDTVYEGTACLTRPLHSIDQKTAEYLRVMNAALLGRLLKGVLRWLEGYEAVHR